jgi:hypothetical protein
MRRKILNVVVAGLLTATSIAPAFAAGGARCWRWTGAQQLQQERRSGRSWNFKFGRKLKLEPSGVAGTGNDVRTRHRR